MARALGCALLGGLLIAASQPAASPNADCAIDEEAGAIWGHPLPLQAIAVGTAVEAAPEAVLALEKVQLAERTWRTDRDIQLPRKVGFNPPAGTILISLNSHQGERRCMRDSARRHSGRFAPCFVDQDRDGRYETVELYRRDALIPLNQARARFVLAERLALPAPVGLIEDPQGHASNRQFAYRRLRIVSITDNVLRVMTDIATQDASPDGQTMAMRDGRPVLVPSRSPGQAGLPPEFQPRRNTLRTINLADGTVQTIDGIRFQVSRSGSQWLLTPLDPRFPEWVRRECDGARLRIG